MTDKYAVFGNPIAQSLSPRIHTAFAEQTQQDLHYDKHLVEVDKFAQAANEFFSSGGRGLNITAPFKLDAFNFADELTQRAKLAGAVNTLIKKDSGEILGDTTDGLGLVNDILNIQQWSIKNKRLLVIGAGGAVRGVLFNLLEQEPKSITLVNRTVEKAQVLAEQFKDYGPVTALSFDALSAQKSPFELIINGSSAGLSGELPPVEKDIFCANSQVYDMVYGKELTTFLAWAKSCGLENLADGLGMLVGQAAESFYLWRGVKPEIAPVVAMLR